MAGRPRTIKITPVSRPSGMAQDAKTRLKPRQMGPTRPLGRPGAFLWPLAAILAAVPDLAETARSQPVHSWMGLSLARLGHAGQRHARTGHAGRRPAPAGRAHARSGPARAPSALRAAPPAPIHPLRPSTHVPAANPATPACSNGTTGHSAAPPTGSTRANGVHSRQRGSTRANGGPLAPTGARALPTRSLTANLNVTSGLARDHRSARSRSLRRSQPDPPRTRTSSCSTHPAHVPAADFPGHGRRPPHWRYPAVTPSFPSRRIRI